MPTDEPNPEIGKTIDVAGIATNLHDIPNEDRARGAAPPPPPVLLLHGSGPGATAWATWRPTIPALSRTMRVVAPDILGFGYTHRPHQASYEPRTWINHIVGLLKALDLPQVSVVGNSFGGALALRLATEHPALVHRLVLMGSAGLSFGVTPSLEKIWGYRPSFEAMRELVDVLAYDSSSITDELVELRYQASNRPGIQDAYEKMFPRPHQVVVDRIAVDEDRIRRLAHPTLIIHGRDDSVIPVATAHRLLDLIPNAELHVFGRCGHWTQFEHQESFNEVLSGFLNRAAGD
jgi:2-hydroxymuconate-semialdehyde hydrolase